MRRWYIVTTYSGYENSVKQDLERRRESMNMTDLIMLFGLWTSTGLQKVTSMMTSTES